MGSGADGLKWGVQEEGGQAGPFAASALAPTGRYAALLGPGWEWGACWSNGVLSTVGRGRDRSCPGIGRQDGQGGSWCMLPGRWAHGFWEGKGREGAGQGLKLPR